MELKEKQETESVIPATVFGGSDVAERRQERNSRRRLKK